MAVLLVCLVFLVWTNLVFVLGVFQTYGSSTFSLCLLQALIFIAPKCTAPNPPSKIKNLLLEVTDGYAVQATCQEQVYRESCSFFHPTPRFFFCLSLHRWLRSRRFLALRLLCLASSWPFQNFTWQPCVCNNQSKVTPCLPRAFQYNNIPCIPVGRSQLSKSTLSHHYTYDVPAQMV